MKIGFLPCYIQLYDELLPEYHASMQGFADLIQSKLEKSGFEVDPVPLCRIRSEFAAAVGKFENDGCTVIATLHAAYSPSLEVAELLAETKLPLVLIDTTPDFEFGFDAVDKLMYNHGIHGVQDLCNLLRRMGKPFLICAGHHEQSDLFDRLTTAFRAAEMAHLTIGARVGTLGGYFAGMGDFRIPEGTFDMTMIPFREPESVTGTEILKEMELDRKRFLLKDIPEEIHYNTTADCLRLRKWIETERLDAFTINFMELNRSSGWETVPFLECSKALARGIGYAGEGDVLTALFCAALLQANPETTFSEMFCPDWKGNRIFLSHMGEVNVNLTEQQACLSRRNWTFGDSGDPVLATGCLKAGNAVLANLAPGPDGIFTMIIAEVTMVSPGISSPQDIRGWFVPPPSMNVSDFLECYSRLGGTHHLVICYNGSVKQLRSYAALMGWQFQMIG